MRIRPTIERDMEAMTALTNTFIVSTAVHFAFEPLEPGEMARMWLDGRDRYPWLTAEIDGRFAGYAKAGPWRTRAAYQWTAEAGIYVEESSRGRGVGKALYAEIIDDLRRRGFHSVIGGVTLPNEASVRLHESLGFEFVGRFREAGHKLGHWHDVGFWQRMLRDSAHTPSGPGAGPNTPPDPAYRINP
ncbi:MAG: N-acetyltransferase [Phycisphaerae bacterium]|nr:N-acetyltransferase [Phycisphaerae bacterium]